MKSTNRFLLISVIFLSILLVACKKTVNAPDNEGKKLFGTWEYFASSGGISGGGMGDSENRRHMLKFTKDGKITKYEKGIVVGVANFAFQNITQHPVNGINQYFITLKNQRGRMKMEKKQFFIITSDTLYLAPSEVSDSYMFHYKRK